MSTDQPSGAFVIMSATLSFNLPLSELISNSSITTIFETIVEDFLEEALSTSNDLSLSNYNVTVIVQDLKEPSASRILKALDNKPYLRVTTSVTAEGSPPSLASKFPFQAAAHSVITKNSDELFKEIYSTALKQLEEPSPNETSNSSLENEGRKKNIALGSSIAGAAFLISLVALLILQRRRDYASLGDNTRAHLPPTNYADTQNQVEEVSSIDDSIVTAPVVGPKNVPHYNPNETKGPLEEDVRPTNDANCSDLKQVSFVAMNAASHDNTVPHAEKSRSMEEYATEDDCSRVDSSFTKLYEKSMPDDDPTDTKPAHITPSQPPKSSSSFKLFSCFVDNTFKEEEKSTLTAQKILQHQYCSSNITPKSNNTRDNKYEVKAPPGALGIVIDSNEEGPFVYEVKATSPLNGMVDEGDKIVSIDGWCCENSTSYEVANWIRKKPKGGEQVLVLQGQQLGDAVMDEESV